MKSLSFNRVNNPFLIEKAFHLTPKGVLSIHKNALTYLDIDDAYIHTLFPLLEESSVLEKPDYFGKENIGAHVSIIYPEETLLPENNEIGTEHFFQVKGLVTTFLEGKLYYVLEVDAPSLLALRKKYGLPNQPCFKRHLVNFHITIATRALCSP